MEKFKVRVNSLLDSNSAQELLASAGYRRKYNNFTLRNGWVCFDSDNNILCVCSSQAGKELDDYKEISLQELRDMVVLKRNDQKDRTHIDSNNYDWYVAIDNKHYRMQGDMWVHQPFVDCDDLKPIKDKEMKEYLVKTDSGNYLYTKNVSDIAAERVIEIPDGADIAFKKQYGDGLCFFQNVGENGADWCSETRKWISRIHPVDDWYFKNSAWIREKESLNDKIATAEVARQESKSIDATLAERQSRYGSFTGVANTTGQLMAVIKNSPNGHIMPYAHEEALHMICSKIARIMNGDINHLDSWHDIGGYSKLIEDLIGDGNEI